jgi:hypothetical protein
LGIEQDAADKEGNMVDKKGDTADEDRAPQETWEVVHGTSAQTNQHSKGFDIRLERALFGWRR